MINKRLYILINLLALWICCVGAPTTQKLYLSGTGSDDTKTWEFFCSKGRNSGRWTNIEVPSQWELQGFGAYTYGRFYLDKDATPSDECGFYRYKFHTPASWKGMNVEIVFEGSMTDTQVKVNGKSVGEIHQGGFTEFSYNISDKLKYGSDNNLLEVKVSKESANSSVNSAERRADWWLFGGIYRPVYLKASPKTHIKQVAVDAQNDGNLITTIYTSKLKEPTNIEVTLISLPNQNVIGKQISTIIGDSAVFTTKWPDIKPWDCEHPNLYEVIYTLYDSKKNPIHEYSEKIGFRTIEFREKDGIYLNGTKLLIKGVNRHCFYPETGRTLNKAISLQDAQLIRQMNMNAVRSHYAPDRHFLEICDSIGLLYLDEFPGWHGKYDTPTGMKLLHEHISRDVNHPCIFLWSNGNEGGWNKELDSMFSKFDPQKRHVIHPWADFNGIDTHHYPAYQTGPGKLANGWKVFMPTEFLHSRYDKGAGAGLEDYWSNYRRNPMFAGGFIWALLDEAIVRTDRNGQLDSDGSNGCDGILGPYREKEGSFYTIRDIWAPIQFAPLNITSSFDGKLLVTNEYLFTNFKECSMKYRTYHVSSPSKGGVKTLLNEGIVTLPPIAPGETGRASFVLPENFADSDILELEMFNTKGESVLTRTWPIKFAADYYNTQSDNQFQAQHPTVKSYENKVMLSSESTKIVFDRSTGMIEKIDADGKIIPLSDGPVAIGFKTSVKSTTTRINENAAVFAVKYNGGIDSIVWSLDKNGILAMNAVILNKPDNKKDGQPVFDEKITNLGLSFSYPEQNVEGMKWLGNGPYRVWKNRLRGANFGCWQKAYNNTITGHSFESLIYPEFKGYHGSLYWAMLEGKETNLIVSSLTDGLYFRVFTPQEADGIAEEDKMEKFPHGDISFLIDINAMRSFKPISEHGPQSQPTSVRIKNGDEGITINLRFQFNDNDSLLTSISKK